MAGRVGLTECGECGPQVFQWLINIQRRGTRLLAELETPIVGQHWQVTVLWRLQSQSLLKEYLPRCGIKQVAPANDLSHIGQRVIYRSRKLVGIEPVPTAHDEIAHFLP